MLHEVFWLLLPRPEEEARAADTNGRGRRGDEYIRARPLRGGHDISRADDVDACGAIQERRVPLKESDVGGGVEDCKWLAGSVVGPGLGKRSVDGFWVRDVACSKFYQGRATGDKVWS
jgi:hypothetical protein